MSTVSIFFAALSTQFPVLLIWAAGIYLCVTRRESNPAISQKCLIAFCLFLIATFAGALSTYLNVILFNNGDWRPTQVAFLTGGLSFLLSIVRTVGWVLILQAIFNQFPPVEKTPKPL